MFTLNEKSEVDRKMLKCDYIRYSPAEIGKINTASNQLYNNVPREDSVISLLNSYLEKTFDVLHAAIGNRFVDGIDIRLVNIGPIELFSIYKLTTSS